MKAFAYPAGEPVNEDGLVELNQVSFVASAETIRAVAQFLIEAADKMEMLGDNYDHLHLQDSRSSWKENWPDIIVCKKYEENI
ncbi:Imm32 family immunity protein [Chitinimonas taiwanensis]|uniref:Uncharacterized protein n=1 Tax=Chitinimonas taiwanensis DSM 18899 TaxID=1121279 RepID=A0A1K2HEW5_9NEIS|nr:hypothetical protein [Chitinimonas taiwanensis]SFZ75360.1 hypothetical protein SAMN02745887_01561 [Chitinimonas taiwanensis DSM 18899]